MSLVTVCPQLTNVSFKQELSPLKSPLHLSNGFIKSFVYSSGEKSKIENLISNILKKAHSHENLADVIVFFKTAIKLNKDELDNHSSSKKAEILFDLYRDAFLRFLNNHENYRKLTNSIEEGVFETSKEEVRTHIDEIVRNRIKRLHSLSLEIVVEKALDLEPSSINNLHAYPDTYQRRDLSFPKIDFFTKSDFV